MITLVEVMTELDRVFDEQAEDGMETVYALVDGKLTPIASVTCEFNTEKGQRIVIMKGATQ